MSAKDRDQRGRFRNGNQVRRQQVMPATELSRIIGTLLRQVDPDQRTIEDVIAISGVHLAELAIKGDRAACEWWVDRFSPASRSARTKIRGLPKPSSDPLGFIDRIAREVADGRLSIDDGAKLGRLVGPLVQDAKLLELEAKFEQLRQRLEKRDRHRPGRCEIVEIAP